MGDIGYDGVEVSMSTVMDDKWTSLFERTKKIVNDNGLPTRDSVESASSTSSDESKSRYTESIIYLFLAARPL